MDIGTLVLGVVAGLTWLIVILVLVQLSRFLAKFEQGRQELDANIIGMAGQLKKMAGSKGTWLQGRCFTGTIQDSQVKDWVKSLGVK